MKSKKKYEPSNFRQEVDSLFEESVNVKTNESIVNLLNYLEEELSLYNEKVSSTPIKRYKSTKDNEKKKNEDQGELSSFFEEGENKTIPKVNKDYDGFSDTESTDSYERKRSEIDLELDRLQDQVQSIIEEKKSLLDKITHLEKEKEIEKRKNPSEDGDGDNYNENKYFRNKNYDDVQYFEDEQLDENFEDDEIRNYKIQIEDDFVNENVEFELIPLEIQTSNLLETKQLTLELQIKTLLSKKRKLLKSLIKRIRGTKSKIVKNRLVEKLEKELEEYTVAHSKHIELCKRKKKIDKLKEKSLEKFKKIVLMEEKGLRKYDNLRKRISRIRNDRMPILRTHVDTIEQL